MKKHLSLLIIAALLMGFNAYAGTTVSGRPCAGGAVAGCTTSTDYAGDKTDYSASFTPSSVNVLYCISYQAITASCASGTWGKAFIAHDSTDTDNVKVCVYTDSTNGTGPPNNETKIACSGAFSCSTDTPTPTCTNNANLGGTATKSSYYFVCHVSDATGFAYHRSTTGSHTMYTKLFTSGYTSPPDPLTATGWTETASRDKGIYVEIY
jgi:hypothetical protein